MTDQFMFGVPRPELVADRLEQLAQTLRREGQVAWRKMHDWEKFAQDQDRDSTRGGGVGDGRSTDRVQEQAMDRAAAAMWGRLASDTDRLLTACNRVTALMVAARPVQDVGRHKTPAQVAAEGGCVSHWRIREWVEVECRPTGEPYYRALCRDCGSVKAETGDVPPVELLKARKAGRMYRVAAS